MYGERLLILELLASVPGAARRWVRGQWGRLRERFQRRPAHLATGRAGERFVARELRRRGYRIVARDWRCRYGEIDLVATDGRAVLFVEVKTRGPGEDGEGPWAEVTDEQQRRIMRAAVHFVRRARLDPDRVAMRFDVAVVGSEGRRRWLAHYEEGAFGW
jgi:putative endonuclease